MPRIERDGEDDLRGRVEVVAVAQQHTERKGHRREICGALIIDKVKP